MKKRTVTKLLSCALAFSMAATAAPVTTAWASEVPAASEAEVSDEEIVLDDEQAAPEDAAAAQGADTVVAPEAEKVMGRLVTPDGKLDAWAQDPETVIGSDAVNEMYEDSFLHFKSGSGNSTSTTDKNQYPAMFVNPNTFDFTKDGYFEFDVFSASSENNRFGVYLDYKDPGNGMFIGFDKDGWFWQRYGSDDDDWFKGNRIPTPAQGEWVSARIEWTSDGKFTLKVDNQIAFSQERSGITHGSSGKIAFKCATFSGQLTEVYLNNIYYIGQKQVQGQHITGKVVDEAGNAISGAEVTVGKEKVVTGANGTYDVEVLKGKYTIRVSKEGYVDATITVDVSNDNATVDDIVLIERGVKEKQTLETEDMSVQVAKNFPSIVQYDMKKGDLKGKTFFGQPDAINTMKINGVDIPVNKDDVKATFTKDKATYVMTLKADNIDCVITSEITVKDNTASFDITKVENKLTEKDENGYLVNPVQTIEIPNHSMISVNSDQQNAHFKGAKISSNTRVSGDKDYDVTSDLNLSEDFMYGFISNNEMSAGLWSNSENEGTAVHASVGGGSKNTRVIASTSKADGVTSLGLASAKWYYDRKVSTDVVVESDDQGTSTTEKRTYVVEHEIMPSAKITITGDENGDGDIDWQDGAVAFRSIMHNPNKCEEVPELVNYRIAMNFGSHAANPFLTNLDGVKRVYLNTEGLGQGVLLKGYGSEGHDSGHPDYGDIGKRIGGAEDMNKLLVEGKKMGALFGVHVNASEMYTEAKAFNDNLSRGYGGINSGWNWLDQGIGINSRYDLATGSRQSRFKELYDQVGNNLDFIYVDVWGNGVSNSGTDGEDFEDAWASRMLAREITGLGWRFTTEWGATHEYDSTLQHWAADLGYGGYDAKGENSEVMRFLRNHQKDSWVADYPAYGGAAQAPLLGGLNMTDFEGWQGRTSYKNYITVMFRHNLITKYLQHYQVVDWKDGNPVSLPTGETWTPEMEITLRNTKDAADTTELVVSRKSNDYSNLADYRSRTITLNGVKISEGAPTGGDGSNAGNETYLIPWNWDSNGKKLADNDLKMYHWNTRGGTTEWTLTKDWQGLSNVILYKLTDEGKTDKKVVNVVNNKITLENIEAEIPYVIFKGEKAPLTVDWQSSKYVYDMGFNNPDINSHRTVSGAGTASIVDNLSANNMLKLEGQVSVSTQLTNLKKGQKYALYVGVDNRSDSKAHITVKSGNKQLATNYTTRSFLYNYVSSDQHNNGSHTEGAGSFSYFQNMFLFFTADATTATLSFDREAGEGATYFDDIRVVETKMDPIKETNEEGLATVLTNDFEDNAQGIWPFVVSHVEGVSDNRTHLSERHDKYTQAGYMCKKVDDVLGGNWSVKTNGLSQRNNVVYQTIPQNFRFEPGETYYVSFDYQMGSNCAYEVRLGDGVKEDVKAWELPEAAGKTKRFGGTFTAESETADNWIGIYSTTNETETGGYTGNRLNFAGYKDFILDNLRIEKVEKGMFIDKTYTEVATAKNIIDLKSELKFAEGVDPKTEVEWSSSNEDVVLVNGEGKVYFVGFGSALISAQAKINGKDITLTSMVYYPDGYIDSNPGTIAAYNTEETSSEDGRVSNILDGNPNSIWHSNYSSGFTVSESNPAVVTIQYENDVFGYENFGFQQRPSGGQNGIIKKYECIVGSGYDETTGAITGTNGTDRFTTGVVITKKTKNGEIEALELPEGAKGNYVQIRVLEGHGNFAAMAELWNYTDVSYDTEEERTFMQTNKEKADAELLVTAKDKLNKALADAKSIYDAGNKTYTAASWDAFKKAYDAAKAGTSLTDRHEVAKLIENLKTAQSGLKKTDPKYEAAKKALKTAVDKAKAVYSKGQKNYTDASWKKFKDAYLKAEAELKKTSTISTMNSLASALTKAQNGLEKKAQNGDAFNYKNVRYKVTSVSKKTVTAVKGTSKKLTSVTVASTVKYKGITFKVTAVSAKAFKSYTKLKKVTIGSNVKTIKSEAFAKCSKLESVKFGKSVSTIEKKAFYNCKKLKKVTFEKISVKTIKSQAFKGTNTKMKVKLPAKTSAKKRSKIKKMMKNAGMSSKATVK